MNIPINPSNKKLPFLYPQNELYMNGFSKHIHNRDEIIDNISLKFGFENLSTSKRVGKTLIYILFALGCAFVGTLPIRTASEPYMENFPTSMTVFIALLCGIICIMLVRAIYGLVVLRFYDINLLFQELEKSRTVLDGEIVHAITIGFTNVELIYEFLNPNGKKVIGRYRVPMPIPVRYNQRNVCVVYLNDSVNALL